ncbi:CDP-diacylglycerol--serine O-phosphatidyltransferase [Vibrio sp.]|nr:CDP-diacylglycerol--serine O-phosphatidyltransferase [Vibrio sp.]
MPFSALPAIAMEPAHFDILHSAKEYSQRLIDEIRGAKQRIYIVALYLEDDDAGREVFTELYQAKQRTPSLDIHICVDWHRAQRGLIGAAASKTNADMYHEFAEKYEHSIPVHGIPVNSREVFGVLHLKGLIVDDTVIYSGASINNVYLHHGERYRYDRYQILNNRDLADSMVNFIQENMIASPAVHDLSDTSRPSTKEVKPLIRQLRSILMASQYACPPVATSQDVDNQDIDPVSRVESTNTLLSKPDRIAVTPLVGLGKRHNQLNDVTVELLASARDEIFICTPYFNFPKLIAKEIKRALSRGVKVTIVVGDKTANDFYIPPTETFRTIGGLPYLYEINLRAFAKANEARIADRSLNIQLWKHDNNSFHLKGIWVDKRYMLLTGSNLNPRAWKRDLENGLLVQDHFHLLTKQFEQEAETILQHTNRVHRFNQLENIDDYPNVVQKLVKRITRLQADHVLKHIL